MKQILYFTAAWCGPCKAFRSVMSAVSRFGANVQTLDVDLHKEKAEEFGIRSVPTCVFLKDGKEVRRTIGAQSQQHIVNLYNNL